MTEGMFENYEKYDERPMMHDFEENGWIGGESKTIMCQTAVNTEKGTMDDIEIGMKTLDQTGVGNMKVMKLMKFLKDIL